MAGSSSHIWCEGCHHVRIHAGQRFRLCRNCQGMAKHKLKQERRRIKRSRAERREETGAVQPIEERPHITVAEAVQDYLIDSAIERAVDVAIDSGADFEEVVATGMAAGYIEKARTNGSVPPTTETSRRQAEKTPQLTSQQESYMRAAAALSDERKLEIGAAYEDFSLTTEQVAKRFSIEAGTLYALIKLLDIVPRSKRPDFKRGPKPKAPAVTPAEQHAAVETILRHGLEPKPALPVPAPPELPLHLEPVWLVKVEGAIELEGEAIEDVLAQARKLYPRLRVRGIELLG